MQIKWCVIGAAGIADRRTIPGLLEDPENTLVAVMDAIPASAERVGKKYGVPYYTDAEAMLKSEECDAVYIATPLFCHYEQAMLVAKYEKHLLIEKPIAMNEKESAAVLAAFRKINKQFSVGYMMRYHSLHQKAHNFIKRGKIGVPTNVRAQFSCWYPDIEGAWRQTKALGGGGAMMDLGVHCLELVEFVLDDEIVEVKSMLATQTFSYEVEDSAIVVFKTKKGTLGHIDVNFNIPDQAAAAKLEIYGTMGSIVCNGTLAQDEVGTMTYTYAPQGDYVAMQNLAAVKPRKFRPRGGNMYTKNLATFRRHLQASKPNYKGAKKAVHIQALVDKIYEDQ